MVWNSDNTSVGDKLGSAPTVVYPLRLELDLNVQADSIRVYPLTSVGKEGSIAPFLLMPASDNHFRVILDQGALQTLWFGIEKYGHGVATGLRNAGDIPREFSLQQNFPNPFNPLTTISFSIPQRSFVSLKIFDVIGREVATIVSENLLPGSYQRQWNAVNNSSGVYFYRLQTPGYIQTNKLLLLR
jgi:hypothetical protein